MPVLPAKALGRSELHGPSCAHRPGLGAAQQHAQRSTALRSVVAGRHQPQEEHSGLREYYAWRSSAKLVGVYLQSESQVNGTEKQC